MTSWLHLYSHVKSLYSVIKSIVLQRSRRPRSHSRSLSSLLQIFDKSIIKQFETEIRRDPPLKRCPKIITLLVICTLRGRQSNPLPVYADCVSQRISIFMFKFHNQLLPSVFNSYFTSVENIHSYNTRATAKKCYYLPKARTNYGLFSVRYQGPKIWNMIEQQIKLSSSIHQFKQKLKIEFFSTY